MLEALRSWLSEHHSIVVGLAIVSGVTAVGSLVALPAVLVGLPADYFVTQRRTAGLFARRHPALRWSWRVVKTVVGFALIVVGLALLMLPGQGLLMVLAGLVLAEFPGKRRMERAMAKRPRIMRAMNWIRRKAGKPEFEAVRTKQAP
ncbi:MAG TPA: PGPGW domain-containing protein [Phycisphaerales bacterium]|nr:PGPGW domain-containing protein [Phycisphaerales bacterium]